MDRLAAADLLARCSSERLVEGQDAGHGEDLRRAVLDELAGSSQQNR